MTIRGTGAAPGLAVGPAVVWRDQEILPGSRAGAGVEAERMRLEAGVQASRKQLEALAGELDAAAGKNEGQIFRVHLLLLEDPTLMEPVRAAVEGGGVSAEYAVAEAAAGLVTRFRALEDSYLRERAADVEDLARRLVANLTGARRASAAGIVVARNLTPSDVGLLAGEKALGFVTEEGGAAGHAAILARALGLPAVAGVRGILEQVGDGDTVALDGAAGEVEVKPSSNALIEYRRRIEEEKGRRARQRASRALPAITRDGMAVEIAANIGRPAEAAAALDAGAEAIGLFRTEFLLIGRSQPPSEEEQYDAYRQVLSRMAPRPVIIRTFDVGGDKPAACWDFPAEANPALGLRGIRFALARPALLRCQLRALVRAAQAGGLSIMLPMVSNTGEVRQARAFLIAVQEELGFAGHIPLGVMVETPAAALLAGDLAAEADFFSIGTNDLTQYALAVDRLNAHVAALYDPLHPAVLRLVRMACDAALGAGKPVGVCGEMAADPKAIPSLLAMGAGALSMAPACIPAAKDAIRGMRIRDLKTRMP